MLDKVGVCLSLWPRVLPFNSETEDEATEMAATQVLELRSGNSLVVQ